MSNDTANENKNSLQMMYKHNANSTLLNILAPRIQKAGGIIQFHQKVPLYTTIDSKHYLFAVGSTEIRDAYYKLASFVNDAMKFGYFFYDGNDEIVLSLVSKPQEKHQWIVSCFEESWKRPVIWYDNGKLHASPKTREELAFLWQ